MSVRDVRVRAVFALANGSPEAAAAVSFVRVANRKSVAAKQHKATGGKTASRHDATYLCRKKIRAVIDQTTKWTENTESDQNGAVT